MPDQRLESPRLFQPLINRQCWRALMWQNADWDALTFLKRILDIDQEPKPGLTGVSQTAASAWGSGMTIDPRRSCRRPSLDNSCNSRLRCSGVTAINSATSFCFNGKRTRDLLPLFCTLQASVNRQKKFRSRERAEQQAISPSQLSCS